MTTDKKTAKTGSLGAACRSSTMLSRLRTFGREEGGAAIVLAALMFPVVIGGMGLGAETGFWYMTQRKLQHAADTAAHAAAVRKMQGADEQNINDAADTVARRTGYAGADPVTATTPTSGGYVGNEDALEVIFDEVRPRLFSAVVAGFYSDEPQTTVTLGARAVAAIETSENPSLACVLALSGSAPGAVTFSGNNTTTLNGCDIASNSTATNAIDATSAVSADCAFSVGGAYTPGLTLTECDTVKDYAPVIPDPYGHVVEPANPGNCKSRHQGHPTQPTPPLTPGCYNGLTVKGEVHFEPGVYYINGGEFNVNSGDNARLFGEGVTFFLANGARLNIGGSIQMQFSAPSDPDDPYAGLLFFGERGATGTTHVVAGSADSHYTGAIYAPDSKIDFRGNSKATEGGCTQLIGSEVRFTGASNLKSECEDAGTAPIVTNKTVAIVE
jgi:hypothetical protein